MRVLRKQPRQQAQLPARGSPAGQTARTLSTLPRSHFQTYRYPAYLICYGIENGNRMTPEVPPARIRCVTSRFRVRINPQIRNPALICFFRHDHGTVSRPLLGSVLQLSPQSRVSSPIGSEFLDELIIRIHPNTLLEVCDELGKLTCSCTLLFYWKLLLGEQVQLMTRPNLEKRGSLQLYYFRSKLRSLDRVLVGGTPRATLFFLSSYFF